VSASNVLEPLVRLGLVLCTPFLRPQLRAALAPELSRLMQCATEDDDPWVRVVARALGSSSGRTDLDAVVADLPLVRLRAPVRVWHTPRGMTARAPRLGTRSSRCAADWRRRAPWRGTSAHSR
jgi:hypothetical protein